MTCHARSCRYPRSATEATRLLAELGDQALVLAGGTTAALSRDPRITTLLDITRMGHDTIEATAGEVSIGCNARIQDLVEHPAVLTLWKGMLGEAAGGVGSLPIRNAVRVGGNAVALFRWSDPPVAYLAMGALFDVVGATGERTLRAEEFFERHPRQVLGQDELLIRVRIPVPQGACGGAFVKLARTAFDLAVVDAAVTVRMEGERCLDARVVVGATRSLPWRAKEAEEMRRGQKLEPRLIQRAARAARAATQTAGDVRTSAELRKRWVEVGVGRALQRAHQAARLGPGSALPVLAERPGGELAAGLPRDPGGSDGAWIGLQAQVNGQPVCFRAGPGEELLRVLRREGLSSVKRGCQQGDCGACTVLVDGRAQRACLLLAAQVQGRSITTVEALGSPEKPHPLQAAFVEHGAIQCGFCTPGMLLAAEALLCQNPAPSADQVRGALDGNLCRCTGYKKIVEAVMDAAERMRT